MDSFFNFFDVGVARFGLLSSSFLDPVGVNNIVCMGDISRVISAAGRSTLDATGTIGCELAATAGWLFDDVIISKTPLSDLFKCKTD